MFHSPADFINVFVFFPPRGFHFGPSAHFFPPSGFSFGPSAHFFFFLEVIQIPPVSLYSRFSKPLAFSPFFEVFQTHFVSPDRNLPVPIARGGACLHATHAMSRMSHMHISPFWRTAKRRSPVILDCCSAAKQQQQSLDIYVVFSVYLVYIFSHVYFVVFFVIDSTSRLLHASQRDILAPINILQDIGLFYLSDSD